MKIFYSIYFDIARKVFDSGDADILKSLPKADIDVLHQMQTA